MAIITTSVRRTPVSNAAIIPRKIGWVLISLALTILGLTWFPLLREEVRYALRDRETLPGVALPKESVSDDSLVPVNEEFSIVIPKIRANAPVVADIDWQDPGAYQKALREGVAHAAGTSYPGEAGNVFIFAHSGVDFYEAARYNAVFYLMNKLESGDEVVVFYQGQPFMYRITEKKIVTAEAVEYLSGEGGKKTLTLMTCYPPGTTLKRLIVLAEETPIP